MSRAWTASSTPSSRDSTWNGKTAPSGYLHKQLDVTQILAYRVSFGAKTAGARIDPSARLILCLERVDQVELQPVKVRFRLARAYPGGLHGILQKGVQSASMPPSEAGHGV